MAGGEDVPGRRRRAARSPLLAVTVTLPATELSIMSHQAPGGTTTSPCTMTALSWLSSHVMEPEAGIVTVACSGRLAGESAEPTYTVRLPAAVTHFWSADDQYCNCRSGTCMLTCVVCPGCSVTRPKAASCRTANWMPAGCVSGAPR